MVEDAESTQIPSARAAAAAALQWYAHMGADEAIGDVRVDGFARSAELAARRASAPARAVADQRRWNARTTQQARCTGKPDTTAGSAPAGCGTVHGHG